MHDWKEFWRLRKHFVLNCCFLLSPGIVIEKPRKKKNFPSSLVCFLEKKKKNCPHQKISFGRLFQWLQTNNVFIQLPLAWHSTTMKSGRWMDVQTSCFWNQSFRKGHCPSSVRFSLKMLQNHDYNYLKLSSQVGKTHFVTTKKCLDQLSRKSNTHV